MVQGVQMKSEPLLLRVADAAELIAVSRAKAYAMCASGELPTVRLGRSTRVPVEGLKRFIAEREVAGISERNFDDR